LFLLFVTGRQFRNTATSTEVVKTNHALPQLVEQYSNCMQTQLLIIQKQSSYFSSYRIYIQMPNTSVGCLLIHV